MPIYEYECEDGHRFEALNTMADRYNMICRICKNPAYLKVSLSNYRFAEPITFLQDLGKGKGYKKLGWKADSGISPKPEQPYKTAKEVAKEEYGGIKEV